MSTFSIRVFISHSLVYSNDKGLSTSLEPISINDGVYSSSRGGSFKENFNNHAKYWSFDKGDANEVLILGGMNIGDYYKDQNDCMLKLVGKGLLESSLNHDNHDVSGHASIVLGGRELGGNYKTIFNTYSSTPGESNSHTDTIYDDSINSGIKFIKNTVDDHGNLTQLKTLPVFIELINNAQDSILIDEAYLSSMKMIHFLSKKINQGKKVTIIIPIFADKQDDLNKKSLKDIVDHTILKDGKIPDNLEIYFYKDPSHKKSFVVDGNKAILGSANRDDFSMGRNGELSILLDGNVSNNIQLFIREIERNIKQDTKNSYRVTKESELDYNVIYASLEHYIITMIK